MALGLSELNVQDVDAAIAFEEKRLREMGYAQVRAWAELGERAGLGLEPTRFFVSALF